MRPAIPPRRLIVYGVFAIIFAAHGFFSFAVRDMRAAWANVPPVPEKSRAATLTLGDGQLSYRMTGLMLQNLGDTGGRATPLTEYDYGRLGQWFVLADHLDARANHIPLLAAYYFGGTPDAGQLGPVVDYLAMAGRHPYDQKWRWLAQAVYLARFKQNDLVRAEALATELAGRWQPGMPGWVRQMPAFVAAQKGDKDAAYDIMLIILKTEADKMHPNEVNFMVGYICERILTPAAAAENPLCAPPEKPGG